MTFRSYLTLTCLGAATASAQEVPQTLTPLVVSDRAAVLARQRFAAIAESIPAAQISETINAVDAEDALKYFPSIFLRKRNNGDTQAVMGTRVWGVSSSARSLIFADGVPLSALIANNNSLGGPRWGLVSPTEIEHIDVLYGPFSSAYAGNSIGAVVEITTRQPNKLEAGLTHTQAWQHFRQYGTRGDYRTQQTAVVVGNRVGRLSFWVSAHLQDSESQPLSYITSTAFPAGTSGAFGAFNKLGAPANVVGSGGLTHNDMTTAKIKVRYDFPSGVRAT
ncbi:MAG: Plug domain-containing protein, partial [Opitutus sp.]